MAGITAAATAWNAPNFVQTKYVQDINIAACYWHYLHYL